MRILLSSLFLVGLNSASNTTCKSVDPRSFAAYLESFADKQYRCTESAVPASIYKQKLVYFTKNPSSHREYQEMKTRGKQLKAKLKKRMIETQRKIKLCDFYKQDLATEISSLNKALKSEMFCSQEDQKTFDSTLGIFRKRYNSVVQAQAERQKQLDLYFKIQEKINTLDERVTFTRRSQHR